MKFIAKSGGFCVLLLVALSCSFVGKLAEKQLDKGLNLQKTGALWDDVPRMDALTDSPTEDLPVAVKLVMTTFVNMVLNSDKESKHVSTDWIIFKYKGGGGDITNFYTAEEMKSAGNWSLPKDMKTPCFNGNDKGVSGNVCLFQKTENGRQKGLIIIELPSKEPDSPYFVYFFRADMDVDPTNK